MPSNKNELKIHFSFHPKSADYQKGAVIKV